MKDLIKKIIKEYVTPINENTNLKDRLVNIANKKGIKSAAKLVGGINELLKIIVGPQTQNIIYDIKNFPNDSITVDDINNIIDNNIPIENAHKEFKWPFFVNDNGSPIIFYYNSNIKVVKSKFNFGDWTTINDKIWYNMDEYPTGINKFNTLKQTRGNVGLYELNITNFGGWELHNGDMVIGYNTKINEWDTLKKINGKLTIYIDSIIETLGSLEYVGGNLELRNDIYSLGNLQYVGGDLVIKNNSLSSLGNVKKIDGKLRIRNTSIEDLGNLEIVTGGALVSRNISKELLQQFKDRNIPIKKG